MKAFSVRGRFVATRGWQTFTKQVAAESEERARDRLLSDLGSKHRLRRRQVEILEVRELTDEEVSDPVVRHRIGGRP